MIGLAFIERPKILDQILIENLVFLGEKLRHRAPWN